MNEKENKQIEPLESAYKRLTIVNDYLDKLNIMLDISLKFLDGHEAKDAEVDSPIPTGLNNQFEQVLDKVEGKLNRLNNNLNYLDVLLHGKTGE